MATPSPRVRLPATAKSGEIIEVKTLISHDMETGQRKDTDGKIIPRRIIKRFEAKFNGSLVFAADWHPSISANPYQSFFVKISAPGELAFTWTDDDGSVYQTAAKIAVE
jgi:sulfur-oxidizing protein SoxZ